MRRLLAAAAVPATLVALAHPVLARAGAGPYAAEFRTATTTFELGGRDGRTWVVGLTLEELRPIGAAVDRSLVVSLTPCTFDANKQAHCAGQTTYRTPVSDGAIAADLTTASVRARVAGALIDLSWTVSGTTADTLATVSNDGVVARRAYEGGEGPVDGVVLGPHCAARGSVGGGYLVRRAGRPPQPGAAPPAHLPRAIAPTHGWAPRCV
jgi:hypothetical protein